MEVLELSLPILIFAVAIVVGGWRGSSLIKHLGSLLKMRILEVVPPIVALPLVVPPYFAKPVSVLSLI